MCMWVGVCGYVCVKGSRDTPLIVLILIAVETSLFTDSRKMHFQQADEQTDPPIEMHGCILESEKQFEVFFQMLKTPSF